MLGLLEGGEGRTRDGRSACQWRRTVPFYHKSAPMP